MIIILARLFCTENKRKRDWKLKHFIKYYINVFQSFIKVLEKNYKNLITLLNWNKITRFKECSRLPIICFTNLSKIYSRWISNSVLVWYISLMNRLQTVNRKRLLNGKSDNRGSVLRLLFKYTMFLDGTNVLRVFHVTAKSCK